MGPNPLMEITIKRGINGFCFRKAVQEWWVKALLILSICSRPEPVEHFDAEFPHGKQSFLMQFKLFYFYLISINE